MSKEITAKDLIHGVYKSATELLNKETGSDEEGLFFHTSFARTARLWFTMGGPNVYVDVKYDGRTGYIEEATITAAWGFESETRDVMVDSSLMEYIESQVEMFVDMDV